MNLRKTRLISITSKGFKWKSANWKKLVMMYASLIFYGFGNFVLEYEEMNLLNFWIEIDLDLELKLTTIFQDVGIMELIGILHI